MGTDGAWDGALDLLGVFGLGGLDGWRQRALFRGRAAEPVEGKTTIGTGDIAVSAERPPHSPAHTPCG